MKAFFDFLLIAFPAVFAVVNPLGAVAPFLAITPKDTPAQRLKAAKRASWVAFLVLVGCGALGAIVFKFFGITIPALKIAGGILLFLVASEMLNGRTPGTKTTQEETEAGAAKPDVAIFPLAIPLISGPGSIATVFILSEGAQTLHQQAALYLAISVTLIVVYGLLWQAPKISRIMGPIGVSVFSRLMGLILAAIAIQFVVDGGLQAFPGLR